MTRIQNTHFALYISDKRVTLKQSQCYQTYSDNVNPKQGYNHAKFERCCFDGIQEKADFQVSFKRGNMSVISREHVENQK